MRPGTRCSSPAARSKTVCSRAPNVLHRYLTLFSIIGVRLMHVAYLARVQPDLPATEVFSKEEIEALHVRVHKALPPVKPPTLRDTVRMIGSLGGHLGRKCDGEPGMTAIWRGWMSLYAIGDRLARRQRGGPDRVELIDALLRTGF